MKIRSLHQRPRWSGPFLALGGLLLAGALAGCGFHLAGDRPVPPALSSVYIDLVQPYRVGTPPLETSLQSRITARGGVVKSHIGDAKAVLRLSDLSETRETLSVGADGEANEYRLVTQVTYELHSGDQELIAPEAQGISRSYSFSVNEILGKEAEEVRLRSYMQDELAALILLRIDATLARTAKPIPAAEPNPPVPAAEAPVAPAVVPTPPEAATPPS
ncbi:LPS assembly lipoprotein LptE [Nevskia soli]|uniref:LPS-assembly lipoprotein LptE n=1 Tax=Nevskia soli TaxID=418856 RepID=UPI0004A78308|nr:LPS assembly lipoprotein LptE [Nevskia soli]